MSSNGCLELLTMVGTLFLTAACAQMEQTASAAGQPAVVERAGGSCQDSDGTVADGTIVAKCAIPGQGMTNCPRYVCRRCNNGAWGGEYTCQLR